MLGEIPRAPPARFTQTANPLHILESAWLGSRDFSAVEVELCDAAQQEISRVRTATGELVQLSNRNTNILRNALDLVLSAASEIGSCGDPTHPITPPVRKRFNRRPARLIDRRGGHCILLSLETCHRGGLGRSAVRALI
jgi:hypothetical protein